jgi:hypothetical protein
LLLFSPLPHSHLGASLIRSQSHSLPSALAKKLLLMFGLVITSACQAVNLFCASSPGFGMAPGITLSESGAVFVKTVSANCGFIFGGFINPQPLNAVGGKIGATLQLQPGLIVVDVFVSDGALPGGVPEVPVSYFGAYSFGNTNPRGNASRSSLSRPRSGAPADVRAG